MSEQGTKSPAIEDAGGALTVAVALFDVAAFGAIIAMLMGLASLG